MMAPDFCDIAWAKSATVIEPSIMTRRLMAFAFGEALTTPFLRRVRRLGLLYDSWSESIELQSRLRRRFERLSFVVFARSFSLVAEVSFASHLLLFLEPALSESVLLGGGLTTADPSCCCAIARWARRYASGGAACTFGLLASLTGATGASVVSTFGASSDLTLSPVDEVSISET